MVTMQQIDGQREVANYFLEKSRDAQGLPQSQRLFRAWYEQQLTIVERMLQQFHKEQDMDNARKTDLKALDGECHAKAQAKSENTFTLRAQDVTAPAVIMEWIKQNFETAPEFKLRQAFDIAIAMREHPTRKLAD